MIRWIFSFFMIILSMNAWAQVSSLNSGSSVAKKNNLSKKEEVKSDWSVNLMYFVSSNLAEESDKRPYKHFLYSEVEYNMGHLGSGDWGITASTALEGLSDGNNFNNKEANPKWHDLDLGLDYQQKIFSQSALILSMTVSLPTGYDSQIEEVKSTLNSEARLMTPFLNKKLSMMNRLAGSYIFNTYSESVTSKESNVNYLGEYGLGFSYSLVKGFTIGAGFNAKSFHAINGENELRTSTSQFIGFKQKSLSLKLSYLNGQYDQNDSVRIYYLDEVRRVIKFEVVYDI